MPNSILISEHAEQRIKERLNTSDRKLQKLAWKAWRSVESPNVRKLVRAEYKNSKYKCRFLMGYVFIFRYHDKDVILITVY